MEVENFGSEILGWAANAVRLKRNQTGGAAMFTKSLVLGAALAAASPATAQWTETSKDDRCSFEYLLENETVFFISESQRNFDNQVIVMGMQNDGWSIKEGDDVGQVELRNGSISISVPAIAADHAFVQMPTRFNFFLFFTDLNHDITAWRDGRQFATIPRDRLRAVGEALRTCRAPKVAAEEAKDAQAQSDFEKDPFAH